MTEEEKQLMLAYLMRKEEQQVPVDMGGNMIPLEYPGEPVEYSEPQQQGQDGGGGVNPQMIQQFMQGGGEAALGAEGGASIAGLASGEAPVAAGSMYGGFGSAPVAVGAAEGLGAGGAAGGGAGGGGMLAAAGPWAALAAAVYLNEKEAKKQGRRDEDSTSRLVDQFSGAVLEQDADALGDKMGGPLGQATKVVGRLGNPEGLLKTSKKLLQPWEWF